MTENPLAFLDRADECERCRKQSDRDFAKASRAAERAEARADALEAALMGLVEAEDSLRWHGGGDGAGPIGVKWARLCDAMAAARALLGEKEEQGD